MRNCCSQEREGSQGKVYSYEMLGVLCPNCEWEGQMQYEEDCERERRAGLTVLERLLEDIAADAARAKRQLAKLADDARSVRLYGDCPF